MSPFTAVPSTFKSGKLESHLRDEASRSGEAVFERLRRDYRRSVLETCAIRLVEP